MSPHAQFLVLAVVVGGWAAACATTTSGGDGESHFLKCGSDEECTKLDGGFACLEGTCRPAPRDASRDAPRADGLPPSGESGVDGRATPVRDASFDRSDSAAPGDAKPEVRDAATGASCECPPDDYFVRISNLNGFSSTERLSFPFLLSLYCDEREPQFANPPCGNVYRLSACKGPNSAPPCVYLAVDGQTPVVGIFQDSSGQTYSLVSGAIPTPTITGRVAVGSFNAVYASQTSEATASVIGSFRACTTDFGPCRR